MSNRRTDKVVRIHSFEYFEKNFERSTNPQFMWNLRKYTAWPKDWKELCGQVIGISSGGIILYAQDQKFIGGGCIPKECYTVLKKEDYPEMFL